MPRVYDLDVELRDIRPRVWRRVRVPADLKLADLHHVIQVLMNWDDHHLHLFEVAGREYGPRPEEEWEREDWAGDDSTMTVAQAFAEAEGSVEYVYDFQNDWRLTIGASSHAVEPGPVQVECLAGEFAAPPEDAARDRLPENSDPSFDVAAVNRRLQAEIEVAAERDAAPQMADPEDRLLADATLLVLFLGSWEEGYGVRMAWKTVRVEILDALKDAGLIATTPARKSVILTDDGLRRAQALRERVAAVFPHT